MILQGVTGRMLADAAGQGNLRYSVSLRAVEELTKAIFEERYKTTAEHEWAKLSERAKLERLVESSRIIDRLVTVGFIIEDTRYGVLQARGEV